MSFGGFCCSMAISAIMALYSSNQTWHKLFCFTPGPRHNFQSYLYWEFKFIYSSEFISIFRIHAVLIKCLIGSYPANKAHSSRFRTYNCWCQRFTPIPSIYGIFIYIWLICLVNAGKYAIDGWYGMHGPSGICDLFSDGELHFVRLVLGHNLPAGNFKLSWLVFNVFFLAV